MIFPSKSQYQNYQSISISILSVILYLSILSLCLEKKWIIIMKRAPTTLCHAALRSFNQKKKMKLVSKQKLEINCSRVRRYFCISLWWCGGHNCKISREKVICISSYLRHSWHCNTRWLWLWPMALNKYWVMEKLSIRCVKDDDEQ